MRISRRTLLAGSLGIGMAGASTGWSAAAVTNRTRAGKALQVILTVVSDGSGDYTSVQDAVNAVPDYPTEPYTISIAPGEYREIVEIPETKTGLTLTGAGNVPADTVLVYDNSAGTLDPNGDPLGTSGSASVSIYPDDFIADNLTFANDWLRADHPNWEGSQAVALKVMGDRSAFTNCRFLGHQDTLYTDSRDVSLTARMYFSGCYVEGDVDFVFGRGTTVWTDSTFVTLDREDLDSAPLGYIFAPSTAAVSSYGFLITDCTFQSTAADGYYKLARPWVPSSDDSAKPQLVIRNSNIDAGIDVNEPYANMDDEFPWQNYFFREYGNTGDGAEVVDPETRPQLTDEEAAVHVPETYLGGWDPAL